MVDVCFLHTKEVISSGQGVLFSDPNAFGHTHLLKNSVPQTTWYSRHQSQVWGGCPVLFLVWFTEYRKAPKLIQSTNQQSEEETHRTGLEGLSGQGLTSFWSWRNVPLSQHADVSRSCSQRLPNPDFQGFYQSVIAQTLADQFNLGPLPSTEVKVELEVPAL